MALITVITPTYNRAKLLCNLYQSLEKQTKHDFEWLIVDDGSNDETADVVQSLKLKATFPVRYLYKKNGGKHTALNVGIKSIESELTIIVDSDDVLLHDAVEKIAEIHKKYKGQDKIGVYCFLKSFSDGKPITRLEKHEFIDSYVKYRIKENRPGDMAEVFKTDVLKEFPFPEFEGERFLSEDVVWIQIGMEYLFAFINKTIYQCEYLSDGLTNNDKPMKFSSPLGSMIRGKMLMKRECGFKQNVKGAIIYNCYKKVSKRIVTDQQLELSKREKVLCAVTWIVSGIFYMQWAKKAEKKECK